MFTQNRKKYPWQAQNDDFNDTICIDDNALEPTSLAAFQIAL